MKKRKRKNILLLVVLVLGMGFLFQEVAKIRMNKEVKLAQEEEFFQILAPYAQDIGRDYGLFPSIILAQAALESSYGKSQLSQEYNNYFGIKGTGKNGVSLDTEEVYGGERVKIKDYFRVYSGVKESFKDYGRLIGKAPRYAPVREAKNREEYAHRLYQTGYSTNPKYGDILLEIVDQYQLDRFDKE